MQTFINNQDATLKKWPQTPMEWETNPEIKFTIARDRIIHPGDRIKACTKMLKSGAKSGSIVNIYYIISEITDVVSNKIHLTETDVTAKAKRIEV